MTGCSTSQSPCPFHAPCDSAGCAVRGRGGPPDHCNGSSARGPGGEGAAPRAGRIAVQSGGDSRALTCRASSTATSAARRSGSPGCTPCSPGRRRRCHLQVCSRRHHAGLGPCPTRIDDPWQASASHSLSVANRVTHPAQGTRHPFRQIIYFQENIETSGQ